MKIKGRIGIIISVVILLGILSIVLINFSLYSKIINEDILNITKLTSTNIYSEINNEIIKPIFVSLTMANDSFVKNWLINKKNRSSKEIVEYLNGIKNKYNYNSAFLVTSDNLEYYHFNGLFKTISEDDDHDVWYYDFLKKDSLYELDVDNDEANSHNLTIFINCKIYDESNEIIGVIGVGIKVDNAQNLFYSYEKSYNLEAFLVDNKGLIQVHTSDDLIEKKNILDDPIYKNIGENLLNKKDSLDIYNVSTADNNEFIIIRYIEEFDWYLVVKKDTSILKESFNSQMVYESLIYLLVTGIVLLIVLNQIHKYQMKLTDISQTDSLTGLLNRRGFDKNLNRKIEKNNGKEWIVFLSDLDKFKEINDKYGHLQGDRILKHIASMLKREVSDTFLARWGGDEFAGIIEADEKEALDILEQIREKIETDPQLIEFGTSISIGFVKYTEIDTDETLIRKADRAMYKSKDLGRNKICKY